MDPLKRIQEAIEQGNAELAERSEYPCIVCGSPEHTAADPWGEDADRVKVRGK